MTVPAQHCELNGPNLVNLLPLSVADRTVKPPSARAHQISRDRCSSPPRRTASRSRSASARIRPRPAKARRSNVKILRGSWNEDLFRVLEGFPDLAHDDEVDACSGALEMLNPQMKSWGILEFYRQEAEKLQAEREAAAKRPKPRPALGSMEWFAEQEKWR